MHIRDFEKVMCSIVHLHLGVHYKTTDSEDYGTLEAITEHYNKHGALMVWNGASDNTIFSAPEFNWVFRAWHDWHHIRMQAAFDTDGERAVAMAQIDDVLRYVDDTELALYMIMLIQAEVNGQVDHLNTTGSFVEDQRSFTVNYVRCKYNRFINI